MKTHFNPLLQIVLVGSLLFTVACDKENIDDNNPNNPNNPGGNGVFVAGSGATDIDGNTYTTIILGNQEWFAQNLRTTRYANGDSINFVFYDSLWNAPSVGSYGYFNNDLALEAIYGKIYNGFAAADARNACPNGWHVPTQNEWQTLATYLGSVNEAGGKLKSTDANYWTAPNTAASNTSGFNVLGHGRRNLNGEYEGLGEYAYFWTSGQYLTNSSGYYTAVFNTEEALTVATTVRRMGYCIRCLKD